MLLSLRWVVVASLLVPAFAVAADEGGQPSALEIVKQCDNKYPGEDQISQLTISLKDQAGNERKTVYQRYWKDMKGQEDVIDKMTLFTTFPPDAKGAAFMRWAYSSAVDKNAEQWIYLPVLRKIRRVSVRDLGDSFLGSDLTYGDISLRAIEADEHKVVSIDKDKSGQQYYVVESTPKEAKPLYSKRVSWFKKSDQLAECIKVRVDYFDTKGNFLKRQLLQWQKVDKAWVWDRVFVQNAQTFHSSFFEVTDVKINTNVSEEWFTERRLRLGLK
ncbi:MAG: outer membrane lipoprotein-sorting protein [Gammaproteobacteria bacterium]|nr:outer membrane lipoprotein-sorting protein [Gammaproteobacteria bacterium]